MLSPGGPRARLPRVVVGLLGMAMVAAACASADPGLTVGPAPTDAPPPSATNAPPPTEPTSVPTDPASPTASTDPSASPVAPPTVECTGTADNRDFFAAIAEAVSWDVYCAVLPGGWFVDSGTYRLSNGGWMEVSYRGPGDARLVLREGAFCQEDGDCVPAGPDVGAAPFGDREGTLVAADDGSWAVTVDRGSALAWLVTGSGLGEATFRSLAEALALVGP